MEIYLLGGHQLGQSSDTDAPSSGSKEQRLRPGTHGCWCPGRQLGLGSAQSTGTEALTVLPANRKLRSTHGLRLQASQLLLLHRRAHGVAAEGSTCPPSSIGFSQLTMHYKYYTGSCRSKQFTSFKWCTTKFQIVWRELAASCSILPRVWLTPLCSVSTLGLLPSLSFSTQ